MAHLRRHRAICCIALVIGAAFPICAKAQLRAFGEAEGFGAVATGGRATAAPTIYHVTNLNDSGAGSFRDAVSASNRLVVFDVAGVINIASEVAIKSNITIAGQTAPGGGIMIVGHEVSMGSQTNVIMRHLRFRPGDSSGSTENGLNLFNAGTVILDHVSVEFANWNNIDSVTDKGNFTIQNSLIADPIGQQFAAHMESLQGPVTWSNNLIANAHNRMPLSKMDTVFKNNIVYNYGAGYTTGDTSGKFTHDIINNYFIGGPGTSSGNTFYQISSGQSYYASGNLRDVDRDSTLDGTSIAPSGGTSLTTYWSPTTPDLPTVTAGQSLKFVTNHAGASITRDELDNLVVSQVLTLGNGTTGYIAGTAGPDGGMYHHASNTGLTNNGLGTIATVNRPAGFDTDNDGVPDAWETSHGMNPAVADSLQKNPLGYFMVEQYINELGQVNDTRTATTPSSNWLITSNWTGATFPSPFDYAQIRGSGAANGSLQLTSGTANAMALSIGGNGPAAGEKLFVAGGKLDVYDTITVGDQNNAELNISGGTVEAYNVVLGNTVYAPSATTYTGTLNLSGGTLTVSQLVRGGGAPGNWNSGGAMNFSGGTLKAGATLTINVPITVSNIGGTIDTNSFDGTLNGVVSGNGGITKKGLGTLTLKQPNAYLGSTIVNQGTLQLGISNAIANGSNLVLTGGKFSTAGFSDTLGSLIVSAASQIDLGAGSSVLQFAASNTFAWPAKLTIQNWTGSLSGDGSERILFGADSTALTQQQLTSIVFAGSGMPNAKLLATGELVPGATPVLGDFSGDFAVTIADIPLMLAALTDLDGWRTSHSLTSADLLLIGDLDHSGSITNADLQGLLNAVATGGAGSLADAVPEPAAIGICLAGIASILAARRQQLAVHIRSC